MGKSETRAKAGVLGWTPSDGGSRSSVKVPAVRVRMWFPDRPTPALLMTPTQLSWEVGLPAACVRMWVQAVCVRACDGV